MDVNDKKLEPSQQSVRQNTSFAENNEKLSYRYLFKIPGVIGGGVSIILSNQMAFYYFFLPPFLMKGDWI
jgi:hypothetical protein